MRVMLLSGSIGKKSCTRTLLRYLEGLLRRREIGTVFWDMGSRPLPIAIPEYYRRHTEHPDEIVKEFVQAVGQADGFMLGSPLYHDSFSGVLKNALDNLPSEAFLGKPVGLVSHSSNIRSCVTPCNNLRPVVRSLNGYAAQLQIGTTDEDYKELNGKLVVSNPKIKVRCRALVEEVISLSQLFNQESR